MSDRLSMLDASFLANESTATPLHVGGLGVFGSDLRFETVLETLRDRIHLVRLGRRRPYGFTTRGLGAATGRPTWVDDTDFDLSFHLRHAALPRPGTPEQLGAFLARLLARRLDRTRPLWELYVIEGLESARVAVFRKVHLAMAGGDRGDPFAVLLDDQPEPAAVEAGAWDPDPPPGSLTLAAGAAREGAERAARVTRELTRLARHPSRLARTTTAAAGDAAGLLARVVRGAPGSPLNFPLSAHRRIATVQTNLEDYREVRAAFGGSVNDVVVAVASDAIGRLLRWRGHDTKDLDLRVMVPVRVHGDLESTGMGLGEATTVGDGVVGVVAPLPVMHIDPVARLYRIMGEMAGLKESRQAVAADNLVKLAGFGTANLHAVAARLVSAEQRYNVALSNAPGPQTPRYLGGVPMEETYAFLPLSGDCGLGIAVSSYHGAVSWGLVGERDGLSDLDMLAGFVEEALADIRQAAREAA